ncbi:hypothetical protein AVR91_0209090 [Amycolatopsis keratiniphila subsp. keratiniphila]|uniref:Uncharacterized protein n=2 Tax=Amycolatopsis keratiniphila TaxID=129921 RepID=A0A1W2LZN7_9PSEU|nr:hypothetical protein AVR91_0209090 [Amycolatopsis keratiniphila subsp. keratiniphila]
MAVSRSGAGDAEGAKSSVRDALIASAGFAVQYLALAQAVPEAGLWPVVASSLAATSAILPIVIRRWNGVRLPWRSVSGPAPCDRRDWSWRRPRWSCSVTADLGFGVSCESRRVAVAGCARSRPEGAGGR